VHEKVKGGAGAEQEQPQTREFCERPGLDLVRKRTNMRAVPAFEAGDPKLARPHAQGTPALCRSQRKPIRRSPRQRQSPAHRPLVSGAVDIHGAGRLTQA